MMNLQDQIIYSIKTYPTLYDYGSDVLHYLFCVIGNAYTWENGQLCELDKEPRKYTSTRDFDKKNGITEKVFKNLDTHQTLSLEYRYAIQDMKDNFRIQNAEKLAQIMRVRLKSNLYPLSGQYSLISTVPDDVQPDWFEGAIEVWNLAYHMNETQPKKDGYQESNRTILLTIKQDWILRFNRDPLIEDYVLEQRQISFEERWFSL